MKRPSVIILTAKYGSGHTQAAKVLAKELREYGFTVIISDLLEESYPTFSHITQSLLLKSFTYGTFYKWFYYGTNRMNHKSLLQFSQYLGRKRLLQLIKQYRPSFLLTTFPIHVAPYLLQKIKRSIPVYTVITDYCAHPYWMNSLIDHYFVGSEEVKQAVSEYGVDERKITVSGIPIRKDFEKKVNTSSIYTKYSLSPSIPVITIAAGAYGVLKGMKELCTAFLESTADQLVVVCGKNEELYKKLQPFVQAYPERFRLFSYVEDIHLLFAVSSCLITKPGGITITEACAMNVPLILHRPIPGQEMENAQYFKKNNAAYITKTTSETVHAVKKLIHSSQKLENMKTELKNLYYPKASSIIIQSILEYNRQPMMKGGGKY